jgi:hypothetical protein
MLMKMNFKNPKEQEAHPKLPRRKCQDQVLSDYLYNMIDNVKKN